MVTRKISCSVILIAVVFAALFSAGCKEVPESSRVDDFLQIDRTAEQTEDSEDGITEEETASDEETDEDAADQEEEAGEEGTEEEQYELGITLADLEYFLEGMDFIVGNKAPAMDIVTISEIKAALTDRDIETGRAELADEVDDYKSKDYIVIGSPCDNPFAAELLKKQIEEAGKCNFFEPGAAWIKLFKTSADHIALYVGGGTSADTRKAGSVVGEFDEYSLTGTAIEVTGPADSPSLSLIIGG